MMGEELEPVKKDYRDLDRITPTTEELLSENIDGEIFLYRAIPQCKVCSSGDEIRRYVDDLLLYPKGYKDILRTIQPLEEKLGVEPEDRISYSSIRTHYRNHLPLDKKQVREVIERKANKNNTSIIDAEGTLLTPEAFYEVVVAKGFEDIVSGAAKPTLSQTFQAMGILQRMEEKEKSGYKPEVLVNQLNIILQAIRDVLPVEWREKVFDKIQLYSEEAQKLPTTMEIAEAQEYIDDDLM
jgi:hypothetical protein